MGIPGRLWRSVDLSEMCCLVFFLFLAIAIVGCVDVYVVFMVTVDARVRAMTSYHAREAYKH